MREVQLSIMGGFRPVLLKNGLITPQELDELVEKVKEEIDDPQSRIAQEFTYAWAKRK